MDLSIRRELIESALALDGFDNWRSPLDSAELERPMTRPSHLSGRGRHAAVMMVLVGDPASCCADPDLLLIRRSPHLRYHAGQIALPGGRQEPEETLLEAAIRETEEEIGVSVRQDEIVGSLRSIYIPPSDFTLTPYVAWLTHEPEIVIQADEVDELIRIRLQELMKPTAQSTNRVIRDNGEPIEAPCYQNRNHVVWGATALVISELVARLNVLG